MKLIYVKWNLGQMAGEDYRHLVAFGLSFKWTNFVTNILLDVTTFHTIRTSFDIPSPMSHARTFDRLPNYNH